MAPDNRELCANTAVITLTVLALSALALVLWYGRTLFLLAFAGLLLAVFLRAVTNLLKKTGLSDALSLTITVLVLVTAITAFVILVAPNVESQIVALWQSLPATLQQGRSQLQQHDWGRRLLTLLPDANSLFSGGSQLLRRSVATLFGALGILANAVVIAFIGLYLAINPGLYQRGAARLFPPPLRPCIADTLTAAGDNLRRWLLGKFALMTFVGISTAIGLFFLHVPLIAPLALLAALLDFIPNIGPVISAVPAVLLALTVGPLHALWIGLLYLAVQVVESYILEPLVQGKAVSLPPAVLISSQVLFGLLLGLPGVFLATPLTVVLMVCLRKLYVGQLLEGKQP